MTEQTIKQTMLYYGIDREAAMERIQAAKKRVANMTVNIKKSGLLNNDKIIRDIFENPNQKV